MSFIASVYVRNIKLCPYNYAEDFRNVKQLILFINFAQNIDCGHVIQRKVQIGKDQVICATVSNTR